MKMRFVEATPPPGIRLFDMKHGDVFQLDGLYYVRSWDGVVHLKNTIISNSKLVPYKFIHFGTDSDHISGRQRAVVIGRMLIEVHG